MATFVHLESNALLQWISFAVVAIALAVVQRKKWIV